MKKELELKLVEKYPMIFKDYGGDLRKTCMAWGMSCGDGWYNLINNLCKDLMIIIKGTNTKITAEQVKEKFGGLRFYFSVQEDDVQEDDDTDLFGKISNRINVAEEMSYKICETCGEDGEVRGGGWLKTLCNFCEEERKNNV